MSNIIIKCLLIKSYFFFSEESAQNITPVQKKGPKEALHFAEDFMKIERSVQEIWPFEHFKMAMFFMNMTAAILKV